MRMAITEQRGIEQKIIFYVRLSTKESIKLPIDKNKMQLKLFF